ncbi:CheR family methyltransferase [Halorhodospira halophila]|uniref:MCP methyltransferase, CheR-type n=1 Tax=Halorhodospira halophila (strain DSM 244 / SL1) TaxID=349124 RepID=A1WXR8_HALHL|nr:CheR family methyltransferase [Halorhodospira halophila]ABM62480.1 MCP methyltransferase, CheR-type [Halorhodospira halophila SL1]MBK1728159.1 chemotaxis protein CheR [Halorhodospira halophila]
MPPPTDRRPLDPLPIPIVAIGGSAGSLKPLQAFLAHLPTDSGAAYVIITHHPSGQRSLLPEILERQTELPVQMVEEGETLGPDRIYIALPEDGWALRQGQLIRSRATETRPGGGAPYPIDAFFRSLAEEAGQGGLAVVLSGTGSDGTLGVKAIKSQSGMVMAQDPKTAEFGDMPANAIATGQVDYVLAPADMPATLVGYLGARSERQGAPSSRRRTIPEEVLGPILRQVRHCTGHDFSGYKTSTLERRLERRMDLLQISDPRAYSIHLQSHPEELNRLFQDFLISVTNFFRDPRAWATLSEELLPGMLRRAAHRGGEFRAWVVGCATGEEAYTLAILIRECLADWEQAPEVRIFATDVDQAAIETARVGRYPAGIADDLTHQRLRRYFAAENDTYRIVREVRDMVIFADHNALQDPPFTHMDLITCRNLLIYLERDHQMRLLALFRYALRDRGLLFLGPSESPDQASEAFEVEAKEDRIYRVAEDAARTNLLDMPGPRRFARSLPVQSTAAPAANSDGEGFSHHVERLLALRFAPPSVVVNDRGEVAYIHGRTGRFLEPAHGPVQNQLVEMARPGLRAPLSQALEEVARGRAEEVGQRVQIQTDDDADPEWLRFEVRRIHTPAALKGFRLVTLYSEAGTEVASLGVELEPRSESEAESEGPGTEAERRLRRELENARQDKQVAVNEMQSTNEELQSMNEELQSMNEELQSSNEELEVAKEEVESLNQELRSVNAELQVRVDDLTETNDDLKNLLDSTHIATLFLDEALNIKRFTTPVQELIAVRPADIGRPVADLKTSLRYDGLVADAESVLDTLIPHEVQVQSDGGDWYLLRIQPYRSTRNVIRGVVCTFQSACT